MLEVLIALLFVLWLLGFFVAHVGAIIHVLLVVVLFALIFRAARKGRIQSARP